LTAPGTLPTLSDAEGAAGEGLLLPLRGTVICGITRCSGLNLPGSLAFSAALTAGLRSGIGVEAADMGTGAEDGSTGGKTDCADAAPGRLTIIKTPSKEEKADFMGHPACRLR